MAPKIKWIAIYLYTIIFLTVQFSQNSFTDYTRDAIFRKMTNRSQTDTNEIANTETKSQTDFYAFPKYQDFTKFYEDRTQVTDKIPRKYQDI